MPRLRYLISLPVLHNAVLTNPWSVYIDLYEILTAIVEWIIKMSNFLITERVLAHFFSATLFMSLLLLINIVLYRLK